MIISLESCKGLTDKELVRLALGNLDYFSCLYQRYEPEMLRYVQRISAVDLDEARDILQESFIKIWHNLNEFDASLKLSSWIYRIVHNETVSYVRRRKSYGKDKKTDTAGYEDKLASDPEPETDPEQKPQLVYNVLGSLPLKYREVLTLKFIEEKSYQEISDILRIPEGTVAIRINRAKKLFRKMTKGIKS
jgi:RNA polymerase sigma-70 factor (ECF subfamily)